VSTRGLFTAEQERVARNVRAIAQKWYGRCHVPELAHLAGTKQESNWSDTAAGDNNQSFGPYQIYIAAHPGIGPEISTNPDYDYGFPTMADRWAGAWLPYAMQWPHATSEERGAILEAFVPAAQGSIDWTPGMGFQRYMEAVAMLEQIS